MTILLLSVLIVMAYLMGSISTAIITCRVMDLPDPRDEGSENPGASNVYNIGGKKAAAITLVGDALKGLIPVLLGRFMGVDEIGLSLIGLAAFFGHLYPFFFSFKGGKGVATALGVILGLSWPVALVMIGTWLVVLKLFKLSSLSALVTAILTPLYVYFINGSVVYTVMVCVLSVILIWRHRSNIVKILDGTED